MKVRLYIALALAACMSWAGASAEDYTWTGAVGTGTPVVYYYWSAAGNWNPAGPPVDTDNTIFNGGNGQVVTLDVDTAALTDFTTTNAQYDLDDGGAGKVLTVNGVMNIDTGGVPEWSQGVYFHCPIAGTGSMNLNPSGGDNYAFVRLYNTNTYSGGTTIAASGTARDTSLYVFADMALGTGTVVVSSSSSRLGRLHMAALQTYGAKGNPDQPMVRIDAGGRLYPDVNDLDLDVTLNGGQLYIPRDSRDFYGDITVMSESALYGDPDYPPTFRAMGDIKGSAKLNVNNTLNRPVRLEHANVSFTGEWNVTNGHLQLNADDCLGTGTVTIGDRGRVRPMVTQTNLPPVMVNSGGEFDMSADLAAGGNVTLNGGFFGSATDAGRNWACDADLKVAADSYLGSGGHVWRTATYNGDITGAAGLLLTYQTRGSYLAESWAYMNHANLSYAGDWLIAQGPMSLDVANALGSGEVTVAGGLLKTNQDQSLDSVTTVIVDENGTLELASTETKQVHVKPTGAFKVTGGNTVLDYTKDTGNIQVYAGCILDQNLGTMGGFPEIDDFHEGDDGFGAFVAATSGDWTVGLYSDTIYRGLAATGNAAFDNGSVAEAAGGPPDPTEGIGMLATGPATFTYSNSTFTTQGTNTIKLYGRGNHVIGAGNTFNNDLEHFGSGMVRVSGSGGISGRRLTLHDGYLDIDADDALSGAVVNLESGASFALDRTANAGTVNVKSGAAVHGSEASIGSPTVTWNWSVSSQYAFNPGESYQFVGPLPAPGVASYIVWNSNTIAATELLEDVVLGDNTRLMPCPTAAGGAWGPLRLGDRESTPEVPGDIVLAAGATKGTLAAHTGNAMLVSTKVDFGSGKLVIGDAAGTFTCVWQGGTNVGPIGTAGRVVLGNENNVTGSIDVLSGTLEGYRPNELGQPATVNLAAGAALHLMHQNAMAEPSTYSVSMVLGGEGTYMIGQQLDRGLQIAPAWDGAELTESAVAPGGSVGEVTIECSTLSFGKVDVGGGTGDWRYGQLRIEVANDGGTPGTDHDHVAVTGAANLDDGELAVSLPLPSGELNPANVNAVVLTTSGGLSGTLASVVAAPGTDRHWDIGDDDVASAKGTLSLVLDADDWTGFGGDSDLNGLVNYLDLGVLATYYDQTGKGWGDGDFNFDGKVDYMDLGVLATNYDLTEGSGGAPVPAPAAVFLLAFGAVGLLRRRR